jgi:ribosomal protein L11 methyltransferase
MPFQTLTFCVPGGQVETLTDALLDAGALSVDVADEQAGTVLEQAWFDEPGAVRRPWGRCRLQVLYAREANAGEALDRACRKAGLEAPAEVTAGEVDDTDWVRLTQAQFPPQQIAPHFWVVPTWEQAPDPQALNLVLDPGAAFGTGSHPTTRLCLRWLVAHIRGGERVLDYGCGSGILAIAALRLGAAFARGIDIDPQALVAARFNAMQNAVQAEFAAPGGESGFAADMVVANILANPLIALAPLLAAASRPGGRVALSGILEEQCGEVAQAYSQWFEMCPPVIEDGWVLLVGRREEGSGP